MRLLLLIPSFLFGALLIGTDYQSVYDGNAHDSYAGAINAWLYAARGMPVLQEAVEVYTEALSLVTQRATMVVNQLQLLPSLGRGVNHTSDPFKQRQHAAFLKQWKMVEALSFLVAATAPRFDAGSGVQDHFARTYFSFKGQVKKQVHTGSHVLTPLVFHRFVVNTLLAPAVNAYLEADEAVYAVTNPFQGPQPTVRVVSMVGDTLATPVAMEMMAEDGAVHDLVAVIFKADTHFGLDHFFAQPIDLRGKDVQKIQLPLHPTIALSLLLDSMAER